MSIEQLNKIGSSLPQIPIKRILHISDSVVSVEMHVPEGAFVGKHKHNYSHISMLGKGTAIVHTDYGTTTVHAPAAVLIEANKWHMIEAVTDIIWFCTHGSSERDVTDNE